MNPRTLVLPAALSILMWAILFATIYWARGDLWGLS